MEKRAVAPLVLGGAGLALAVAIGVLVVKVRSGAPQVAVNPGEASRASRAAPPSAPPDGPRPGTSPPRIRVDEPEEATRPEEAPPAAADPAAIAQQMVEANRLYDRGEYEAAGRAAEAILQQQPDNVKMLRIAASCGCILGDAAAARAHYDKLPASDQEQIARRCRRYGVEF